MQILNTSGIVQIDQDYLNYSLVKKGKVSLLTSFGGASSLYYGSVTYNSAFAPIFAFRASDNSVGLYRASVTGSTYIFFPIGEYGIEVDYWIFDKTSLSETTLDSFGLEIRNTSGDIVFHSSVPVLKIVNLTSSSTPSAFPVAGTPLTLPAGRQYAVIQSASTWYEKQEYIEELGDGITQYRSTLTVPKFNSTGTELSSSGLLVESYINPGGNSSEDYERASPACQFFVADVTNLLPSGSPPPPPPPPGATYSITPNVPNVTEGGSVTYAINTTNFGSGTLYWTTTGTVNSGDFTTATSGSIGITDNTGVLVRTLTNDLTTEGPETFAIQLRTVSTSGTIVATSDTVTVGDTSLSNIGNLTQTLGSVTISASGTVGAAGITGNLSQTLGSVTISASGTVGAGADVVPNDISWGNITGVGSGQNANQTISGINTTITLSMQNSTSPSALLAVYVNNSYVTANTSGETTTFTVNNNDTIYFSASANFGEAPSGSATIRNVSNSNNTLNTFSINITAEEFGGGGGIQP